MAFVWLLVCLCLGPAPLLASLSSLTRGQLHTLASILGLPSTAKQVICSAEFYILTFVPFSRTASMFTGRSCLVKKQRL
jgi:hypothetical protein